jgi:predicted PurR-regulated permease PerM
MIPTPLFEIKERFSSTTIYMCVWVGGCQQRANDLVSKVGVWMSMLCDVFSLSVNFLLNAVKMKFYNHMYSLNLILSFFFSLITLFIFCFFFFLGGQSLKKKIVKINSENV